MSGAGSSVSLYFHHEDDTRHMIDGTRIIANEGSFVYFCKIIKTKQVKYATTKRSIHSSKLGTSQKLAKRPLHHKK